MPNLLLLLPVAVVAGGLIYLWRQSGVVAVQRALWIDCPPQAAFARVRDLRGWRDWSPWLMHEPEARLTYSEQPDQPGGWYDWDGEAIGAGLITHQRLEAPVLVEQALVFRRPFKSTNAVRWAFAARDGGTEVTWTMRGRMPFLLRWLAPLVAQVTSKDFELGLVLLRACLDPAAEQLRIRFLGDCEAPARQALSIPFDGDTQAMVAAMGKGFPRLVAAAEAAGIAPAGPPFTACYRADLVRDRFQCDFALPVPAGRTVPDLAVKTLGGGRYYLTEVQGSYTFLALAWHSVMGHLRMHKRQHDRARPALEVYVNNPRSVTDRNALLTRIYVPMR